MSSLSNHKIIPYPTKKVVTKFYFVSGEKLEVISADNCNLEDKKERTAHSVSSCYYIRYSDCIISTNHITHITFEYDEDDEDDEDEKNTKSAKPSIKDIFSLIANILHFVLMCMLFIYMIFYFYSIFKK